MPFVEGQSLRQRLSDGRPLPLAEVEKVTREVAAALAYAGQRGLVHRDIKPENILLAGYSSGAPTNSWNTVVADFGIAMPADTRGDHLTITGAVIGSPHYMSPEQAMGGLIDQRRIVRFTKRGRAAYAKLREILRDIEREWSAELGPKDFAQLKALLSCAPGRAGWSASEWRRPEVPASGRAQ
jgi:serine/threonine protein kinase